MPRDARASLIALGTVLAVTAIAWILAASWYEDDGCTVAQWRCSAGSFGLTQGVLGLASAAIGIVWLALALLWRSDREGGPSRAALGSGASAGLVLLAIPWIVWLILESI